MKKLICLFFMMATFVAATFATPADSTKTDSVKGFSKKEYTVISDGDTTIVTPGDTTHNIQFTAADSVKATGKTDFQMINGKKTKIKEIEAHGKKAWVLADQDLSKPIEMWCDEDPDSDPIAGIWYGLISMLLVVSGFFTWRVLRR